MGPDYSGLFFFYLDLKIKGFKPVRSNHSVEIIHSLQKNRVNPPFDNTQTLYLCNSSFISYQERLRDVAL